MTQPINYDPNFPLVKNSYGSWQPQFLQNFTQLALAFAQNHVPLTAASDQGNHTIIQLLEKENPQQTNVSEFSVYSKPVEYSDKSTDETFMRFQGNGTEFQYTNYQIYPLTIPNSYFTFLPGKIICYFGLLNAGPGKFKNLPLNPPIAKNIMSANFTNTIALTFGGTASYTPIIQNGIITSLNLTANNNIVYYLVMANI